MKRGFLIRRFRVLQRIRKTYPAEKASLHSWFSNIPLAFLVFAVLAWPATAGSEEKKNPAEQVIEAPRDFVEKNLTAYRKLLDILKNNHQEQFGSYLAATAIDPETIARDLPKGKELRLSIQYPEAAAVKEEKISFPEGGSLLTENFRLAADVSPFYNLTASYSSDLTASGTEMLVAADPVTSQSLGLPHQVRISLRGDIIWTGISASASGSSCCLNASSRSVCIERNNAGRCKKTSSERYCGKWADLPKTSNYRRSDLLLYANDLNLKAEASPGTKLGEGMKMATFSSPGLKKIRFTSSRKYSNKEPYRIYHKCVPEFSASDKALAGYKAAGEEAAELQFTAVSLKGFGFAGYDISESYGEPPQLDFFYRDADVKSFTSARGNALLSPLVLLDYGDAGGLKAHPASKLNAPVTLTVTGQGPFFISKNRGNYSGGTGETRFRITLGGNESVEHRLTANRVNIVLDAAMSKHDVVPGKNHKVLVQIKGPADMKRYEVRWSASGGAWRKETTDFSLAGQEWQSEGAFLTPFAADNARQKGQPVKIALQIVDKKGGKALYTYENKLATTDAAISGLELHAGLNKRSARKVDEPIDLILGSTDPMVLLSPQVVLPDGEVFPLNLKAPSRLVKIDSSNPEVASLRSERYGPDSLVKEIIVARPTGRLGTTQITARMGGSDYDKAGSAYLAGNEEEIKSNTVNVSVNKAVLIADHQAGGRTAYRLIVTGPADMSKYLAIWRGEASRSTRFAPCNNGYTSDLETTLTMEQVSVVKNNTVVASFNIKSGARKVNIKLLPVTPPFTVLEKVALSDAGSLESITDCKKKITPMIDLFGFNPGMPVEDYCRSQREQEKQKIKTEREDQKTFNEMIRNLDRQGQELVVVADSVKIGAAVKGDLAALDSAPFCSWRLERAGAITLAEAVTPVETISANEGGCFNNLVGLKNGFNPDMTLRVELILLANPQTPLVITGESITAAGGILYR
ncbi:MAG: hypothetical protein PHN97_07775 [Smithellaceae bacterium]|jgi:hypothetical protein|nr:hypothetical protein [Smithellaceae bacterium]